MKTVRMSRALATMVGAASLFLMVPVSLSEVPGEGWDVFYTGEGEPISNYQRTLATGAEGQGFDAFNVGDGVKIDAYQQAYMGTSMGSGASDGWDTFRVGEGDPLP
jgi:hypothetical protein